MRKNLLYKKLRFTYVKAAVFSTAAAALLFFPTWTKFEKAGDNMFTVLLDGEEIGVVAQEEDADECLSEARKILSQKEGGLVLAECDIEFLGEEALFGRIDRKETIIERMAAVLSANVRQTLKQSYTVKINEYTVNVANTEEVLMLLQASIDRYDNEHMYQVSLGQDHTRELNVLTASVDSMEEKISEEEAEPVFKEVGIHAAISEMFEDVEPAVEKDFEDYDLGLVDMRFGDEVEVVESYLREDELTPLSEAIEQVTKDQEKNKIYEVVSGDTLSGIAYRNDLTIEKLISMNNEMITDENSMIRVGDELIITVPEPELSVEREEENYYEEDYEAEIIYVDNDDWYTNQTKVLQEPSAGHRRVIAMVSYRNNEEVAREIIKEEIVMEAVPKIVERGTKIPPTYIKPITGGRLSSRFGRRSAPTKGASTYHKGIDWATPVGTAVMASAPGTVTKAGWGRGYGYVVYIDHADGRQTRYGHLSKVLVSVGQQVSQGEKIALSGNTGVSTGPHVHFEILINGSQVNPLDYLN